MTPEQLAREIVDECRGQQSDHTLPYITIDDDDLERIATKHIGRIFRMAEATIRDRLSRVRVCDDQRSAIPARRRATYS